MKQQILVTFFCAMLSSVAASSYYTLQTDYSGSSFFDNFDFFSGKDPLGGFERYQNKKSATELSLAYITNHGSAVLRADNTTVTPNGRPSVRIHSKESYNGGLFIFDINHMPTGCGTWPAYWMVGPSWPSNGELDILEGVNTQTTNGMTLYTNSTCSMVGTDQSMTGTASKSTSCDVNAHSSGCGIKDRRTSSYGAGLNKNGGGIYAMEWDKTRGIKIWFFPRKEIPESLQQQQQQQQQQLVMDDWGVPVADYPFGSNCHSNQFNDMRIIINLTLCGRWAGNQSTYSAAGCPSDCEDFVGNNPQAFDEAYWDINSLRTYQKT